MKALLSFTFWPVCPPGGSALPQIHSAALAAHPAPSSSAPRTLFTLFLLTGPLPSAPSPALLWCCLWSPFCSGSSFVTLSPLGDILHPCDLTDC